MKNSLRSVAVVAVVAQAGLHASTASAQITWTSSVAPAPTYVNTLNFDEAPIPGSVPGTVAANAYASRGVTSMTSYSYGTGGAYVGSANALFGTTMFPTSNQAYSGVYLEFRFAYDLTAFSAQFWESAPNANFMEGGASIDLYNNNTLVNSLFITNPFWTSNISQSATLPTWFNAVAAPGTVFNRVIFNGYTSILSDSAVVDNMSWVPTPGAAGVLALGGLVAVRRRR